MHCLSYFWFVYVILWNRTPNKFVTVVLWRFATILPNICYNFQWFFLPFPPLYPNFPCLVNSCLYYWMPFDVKMWSRFLFIDDSGGNVSSHWPHTQVIRSNYLVGQQCKHMDIQQASRDVISDQKTDPNVFRKPYVPCLRIVKRYLIWDMAWLINIECHARGNVFVSNPPTVFINH